jgi:DNA helicase-2/ATP-dependent DNA helicase PcrA
MMVSPDPAAAEAFVELAATDAEVASRAGLAADLIGLPAGGDPVPDPRRPRPATDDVPAGSRRPSTGAELPPGSTAEDPDAVDRHPRSLTGDVPVAAGEDDPDIARWRREARILLAERDERARHDGPLEVALPPHLSVSQLVVLRRDPQALARSLRRPLPRRPTPYARRGTAFHAWLEQRFGSVRLLDVDELPGAADDDAAADEELLALQEAFLAGEWAERTPIEVEVPFATSVSGVVVRGRMDAVFAEPGGRFDVIDWKTGRRPTAADAAAAAVQLSAYRLAWAALAGVPVTHVRAGFHYVRDGVTVRPADLLDAGGLAALIEEVPEPTG